MQPVPTPQAGPSSFQDTRFGFWTRIASNGPLWIRQADVDLIGRVELRHRFCSRRNIYDPLDRGQIVDETRIDGPPGVEPIEYKRIGVGLDEPERSGADWPSLLEIKVAELHAGFLPCPDVLRHHHEAATVCPVASVSASPARAQAW